VSGSQGWSQRHPAGGRTLLSLAMVVGITGCDVTTSLDQVPQEAPVTCGFPGGTRLVFAGEAALSQLGLAEPGLGDEWGMVYVTADELRLNADRPLRRGWCLVPPPGSDFGSQVGELPRDWVLPDPLPPLAQPPVRRPQPQVRVCSGGQQGPAPSSAEWSGWEFVAAMQGSGHDQLQVAAFAGGVVAIQTPPEFCEASAGYDGLDFISNTAYWLSGDGRTWEVLSVTDAFGEPVRIATLYEASGGDLVAISALEWDQGAGDALPYRAWRSADGRAWEPIEDWSAPSGWVLRGADRWLLVPQFEESQAGAIPVWESPDGYAWTPSAIELPEGARPASATASAASEGGFAILACPQQSVSDWNECRTVVSEDGSAWEVSDALPGRWWQVMTYAGEWRAVSWDRMDSQSLDGHLVRVWRSEDAITWEPLAELSVTPERRGGGEVLLYATLADAGPVLVLSQAHPTHGIRAWSSYDGGVTWEQDGPRLNMVLASLTYEEFTILAGTMNDGPIVFWIREE
jgi:hypothetical protein